MFNCRTHDRLNLKSLSCTFLAQRVLVVCTSCMCLSPHRAVALFTLCRPGRPCLLSWHVGKGEASTGTPDPRVVPGQRGDAHGPGPPPAPHPLSSPTNLQHSRGHPNTQAWGSHHSAPRSSSFRARIYTCGGSACPRAIWQAVLAGGTLGVWRAPGMRLYASSAGRLGRTQSPGGAVRRPWPQGAATCLPSRTGPLRPPSASSESSCVVGRVSPRPLCRSLSASAVLSSGPSRRLFWFGDVILPSSSRLPSSAPSVCDASPSCVAPGTLPLPERHRTLTAGGRGVRSLVTFSRVSIF